jgi:hypothetical protein
MPGLAPGIVVLGGPSRRRAATSDDRSQCSRLPAMAKADMIRSNENVRPDARART